MKKQTCAEVAKEFVENFDNKYYADKFKSCTDYPREPEVVELTTSPCGLTYDLTEKLRGKQWRVVATEIMK